MELIKYPNDKLNGLLESNKELLQVCRGARACIIFARQHKECLGKEWAGLIDDLTTAIYNAEKN